MISPSIILAAVWLVAALQSSTAIEQVPSDLRSAEESAVRQDNSGQIRPVSPLQPAIPGPLETKSANQAQLTDEKSGKAVDQLGPRDRNTQSTRNLSERSQGFDTRVIKLEGTDRCSAELLSSNDRQYCQRVIENRSAEYTGPKEIELTPEQELAAKRNLKLMDGGTDNAIKRLANSRESLDDDDSQAVASTVLNAQADLAPPVNQQPAEQNLSAETQALIDAIVRNAAGNPGT